MALRAPRYLNAPPCWRFSHLNTTRHPARSSSLGELMTGVRTRREPMRSAAARTSAKLGSDVVSVLTAGQRRRGPTGAYGNDEARGWTPGCRHGPDASPA